MQRYIRTTSLTLSVLFRVENEGCDLLPTAKRPPSTTIKSTRQAAAFCVSSKPKSFKILDMRLRFLLFFRGMGVSSPESDAADRVVKRRIAIHNNGFDRIFAIRSVAKKIGNRGRGEASLPSLFDRNRRKILNLSVFFFSSFRVPRV